MNTSSVKLEQLDVTTQSEYSVPYYKNGNLMTPCLFNSTIIYALFMDDKLSQVL